MTPLALSPPEIAVLYAAQKASTKSEIVGAAVSMVSSVLFDGPLARIAMDRMLQSRFIAKDSLGRYELTESGSRAAQEALAALDKFIGTLRYGVRA